MSDRPNHQTNMPRNPLFVISQLTSSEQTYHKIHSPVSDWKKSNDDIGRLQDVMPVLFGNLVRHGDAERDGNGDGGRQKGRLGAEFFHYKIYEIMHIYEYDCVFTINISLLRYLCNINTSLRSLYM